MFQKAYRFPFPSVAENIALGLKVQGADRATMRAEVRRMLGLVELPGIEGRRPAQLSGGEQQRVALARASVTRPRVLQLDEPFSSLDPAVRQTLQEAVRRIQGGRGDVRRADHPQPRVPQPATLPEPACAGRRRGQLGHRDRG